MVMRAIHYEGDFSSRRWNMKIAQIASPWIAIPPKNYGGTENVLYTLVEEQVAQGHKVTLFAPGDAKTSAKLVSFFLASASESLLSFPLYGRVSQGA
jgi:hypothetical protein